MPPCRWRRSRDILYVMHKAIVYIDESGTLPDPADTVVVVAAVGTVSPERIDALFKRVKKKAAFTKPSGEIKYYTAGDKTKTVFFNLLAHENLTICVLVVDKIGRAIPDTPDHYAALCMVLLTRVLRRIPTIAELRFDRHFSKRTDTDRFNELVRIVVGKDIGITHVDSMEDKRVNVADMVAGAMLAAETGRDTRFRSMIKHKVTVTVRLGWKEIKERFLAIKKLA